MLRPIARTLIIPVLGQSLAPVTQEAIRDTVDKLPEYKLPQPKKLPKKTRKAKK